ncbi:MAG TPA: autotransporter assembly complex family protein [Rhizomicrobium sp.]|nr:autotransporter assembly complex family protein [Rhizomicrobium sp.]
MKNKLILLVLFAALAAGPLPSEAADPQAYDLKIDATGNAALDEAVAATSLLGTLHGAAPPPPFALIERARSDVGRIETVLNGLGYYKPGVSVAIAGRDTADPDLPKALDAVPQGTSVPVHVVIAPGPLYRLREIAVDGALPAGARDALKLAPGQPAVASDVLDAQARLLAALQEDGYAFAKVDKPVALLDDEAKALDVSFKIETGARATIGAIAFHGLKDVHEHFVREALGLAPGERYRPSAIERARQDVLALGVFNGVTVRPGDRSDGDAVPLVFDVQERPAHVVALSASYSTDLGASASVSWSHRNLFGDAEQLNLSAAVTGAGGTASSGIGYNLSAAFIKPRFLEADQAFEADLLGVKQSFDAYDQTAQTAAIYLRRALKPFWKLSAGFSASHDEVTQQGVNRLYQLLALPLSATYDSTGLASPLLDPLHGGRVSLAVTPTLALGTTNLAFAGLQASGSIYFDLFGDGRSVVAMRALLGSIVGGSSFDLPPDQRLYAGGSATVRGYAYQSIGPHFADGTPAGATSLDAATIEFRQRVLDDWGAVAFVDAGQAGEHSLPFDGALHAGAGVGVRYYSPIGAIRADIAVPLNATEHGDSFEIYIGIGQAF